MCNFCSVKDEQMSNKVGVLRTNRLWFLSRDYWRIHEMNHLELIPIMNTFFWDPIFPGKPTSLSNKPSIKTTPYPWMNFELHVFLCIRFSYFSHITAAVLYIVSFYPIKRIWVTSDGTIPPSSHEFPSHHHPTPRTGDSPWQLASRWGRLKTMCLHPVGGRNPRSLPGLDMDENCGPLRRY